MGKFRIKGISTRRYVDNAHFDKHLYRYVGLAEFCSPHSLPSFIRIAWIDNPNAFSLLIRGKWPIRWRRRASTLQRRDREQLEPCIEVLAMPKGYIEPTSETLGSRRLPQPGKGTSSPSVRPLPPPPAPLVAPLRLGES